MNKVMSSSILLVIQRISERSLGLISTLILARILTPEDFGIIAKAMLVLWFVQTLAAAGTESYILQKETVLKDDINTVWTLNFFLRIFAYFSLVFLAVVYRFYTNDNDLFFITLSLGSILVISAFNNPGILLFKRDQNYTKIVMSSVIAKLITIFVVIPAALVLRDYWAIVIGQIVSSLIVLIFSYFICDYRPWFCVTNIKDQWRFSKWLIPQEILGYFRVHIDTIIVGGKFKIEELGAYNNMKYFATIPMLQLVSPAMEPLHAELGKVQHNQSEMKFQINFTTFILGFIVGPIIAGLFFGSEQIVLIILGGQWVNYHTIFGILSLGMIPFVFIGQSNRLLMIKNKTKYIMIFEFLSTLFICLMLVNFKSNDIGIFAFLKFIIEFFLAIIYFQFSYRYCLGKGSLKSCLLILYPTFVIGFFVYLFMEYFKMPSGVFLYLLILGSTIAGSGFLLIFLHFQLILSSREKSLLLKLLHL